MTHTTEPPAAAAPQLDLVDALGQVADERRALQLRETRLVQQLREQGVPWRVLADALGVTPQAVQQRHSWLGP